MIPGGIRIGKAPIICMVLLLVGTDPFRRAFQQYSPFGHFFLRRGIGKLKHFSALQKRRVIVERNIFRISRDDLGNGKSTKKTIAIGGKGGYNIISCLGK